MKLDDALEKHRERILVDGLPGSGKSTLVAGLAAKFNLKWIDTERGVRTLQKLPPALRANIEYYGIPDSATFPVAADTLVTLFKNRNMNICNQHGKHNCALCMKANEQFSKLDFNTLGEKDIVVIDTITQLSASLLAHQMRNKPIEAKPERDDWGSLRKFTEFFTSQIQAADFNLVVIAHLTEAANEAGKSKLVPNFGSAAASAAFAKAFDHVIYCDQTNKKHVAYSSSTALPNVLTKSRLDIEIEKMDVPSLLPFFRS